MIQLKARWSGLRGDILSAQNIAEVIQSKVTRLQQGNVIKHNFERYQVLGQHLWPNHF